VTSTQLTVVGTGGITEGAGAGGKKAFEIHSPALRVNELSLQVRQSVAAIPLQVSQFPPQGLHILAAASE
jgi:hypothetical protein